MNSNAILKINTNIINQNIKVIKQYIGSNYTIIPVLKADMYGIGINNILGIIKENNMSIIAVAHILEAITIRELGYKDDILILIQPSKDDIIYAIENNLTISCGDIEFLLYCQNLCYKYNRNLKLHMEIDVGMGRTGLSTELVTQFLDIISKCNFLSLDGIFAHLPSNAYNTETKKQINKFKNVINSLYYSNIPYIHLFSSGGIENLFNKNSTFYNSVRCGLGLLGYRSLNNNKKTLTILPSIILYTYIITIKEYRLGSKIGYNRYILKRNSKIGVIPIGFADILIGYEAPGGYVVINGKKAEVISICMDTMMIDVTDVEDINIGTKVYIWDNDIVKLEDWGTICNTSVYEIISLMSNRIERIVE